MKTLLELVSIDTRYIPRTGLAPKAEHKFTFKFDSRETYLEFRSRWRKEYAELSSRIRNLRAVLGNKDCHDRSVLQSNKHNCRQQADALMQMRKASKVESQRQWLKAHPATRAEFMQAAAAVLVAH